MTVSDLPDFIGIGAAKSGTTWLAKSLAKHPDVFVPSRKELNSFDYLDFDEKCIEQYKRHFACFRPTKAKGEFSTIYLQSERAPPRIKRVVPDVKLVVSLRNPIEQIHSHYWHLRRQNFHQGTLPKGPIDIERALNEFPSLLVEPALYHKHLTRWFRYFPDRQVLIVFYDDIIASPASVLKRVFDFIGIACMEDFLAELVRTDKVVRKGVSPKTPGFEKLYRMFYSVLVRNVYNPLKRAIGPRHAAAVKDGMRVRQILERTFFDGGYPAMEARVRCRLQEMLQQDIQALAGLTGRDLSHWH